MGDFDDAGLIARVLVDDDRNAFGELVRRYQSDVRALLRRMAGGDDAMADELAQQTFVKAYRNLSKFGGRARFATWLYRIAYNTFVSSTRGKRAETHENIEEIAPPSEPRIHERAMARIDVARASRVLNAAERMALTLFYGRELPHEEIAQVMNCPLGTVKTHINRGRAKMRSVLCPAAQAEEA